MKSQLNRDWEERRASGTRIRTAAADLASSEGELLEFDLGKGVIRLKDDFDTILTAAATLGPVKAITRNDVCVHEKIGEYLGFKRAHGPIALLNNAAIDLRLFLNHWARAYAVTSADKKRRSLQFFDAHGAALHKIFLTEESHQGALDALVADFRDADQASHEFTEAAPAGPPVAAKDHAKVDAEALLAAWGELQDTHDFHALLRKFKLTRTQAFALAEGKLAWKLPPVSARQVLEWAKNAEEEIMVFVGNHGAIQIHSGGIFRVVDARGWLNVLDADFNLHIKEEEIAEAWRVLKPTKDGAVNSLELFDQNGEAIAQFFGVRKPGQAERAEWLKLISGLSEGR